MNKQASIILIILLIIITACLVVISLKEEQLVQNVAQNNFIMEETNIIVNNEEENSLEKQIVENITDKNINDFKESIKISEEDKNLIEKYVNIICNGSLSYKLPLFNDINNADKTWIYSHLSSEDGTNYITKQQIEKQLHQIFGNKLNIDVDKDIKLSNDVRMPTNSEVFGISGKYSLPIFGMNDTIYYIIDNIIKHDKGFIVSVVEFNESIDMEKENLGDELIISTYNENSSNSWKWKEVFKIDNLNLVKSTAKNLPSPTISEKVMKNKSKFESYNITIEKDEEGLLYVNKITK